MATLVWALAEVEFFKLSRWDRAIENLPRFLADFFPPDFDPAFLRTVSRSLLETLQMAYAGTVLGAVAAVPFSVLATRALTGPGVSGVTRIVLAGIRTIPSLLWALIFIVLVGLGPLAGVMGIAAYTLGYLGKLYYESFEGVDPEVVEAVRSTGASTGGLVRHAFLPEAANPMLSQLLFIFEYNVRASSILGFVGAGGIGVLILRAFSFFEYDQVATILLLLLAIVLLIDLASSRIRRKFLLHTHPGAAG